MEWDKLLNFSRLGSEKSKDPHDARSEPERDADRIIFSGAFRRMSRKAQVHPLVANDHVHTRLTHSIEVARVGNTLGKAIHAEIVRLGDLPEQISAADFGSILQAACLAHDIGNPPFGHAGENAMMHWFSMNPDLFMDLPCSERFDINQFDGNAQGFRILTQTENHLFAGGLQLTYATLATSLKYPRMANEANTANNEKNKFSVFLSEKDILDEVAGKVGLLKSGAGYMRHPLAFLAEAADDICYCVLDLEDAVELNILQFSEVEELLLKPLPEKDKNKIRSRFASPEMFRVNLARMRGPVFDYLVNAALESFMNSYKDIMAGKLEKDLFTQLGEYDCRSCVICKAKKLGKNKIYTDQKKVEIELGSFSTLSVLLNDFINASKANSDILSQSNSNTPLSWKSKLVTDLLGDNKPRKDNAPPGKKWNDYLCYRRAIDYISGMTDNYATYIAKQLKGMAFSGMQRP